MPTIAAIAAFLEQLAPARLAEDWDNVGLLVGDRGRNVAKLMTCLTVTPASAAEAVEAGAELIVAHHPIPFAATKRLTADTTVGRLLLDLIAARIAVFSAHTAFDSAGEGINQRLAAGLQLRGIAPLLPHPEGQGAGRWGWLADPLSLGQLASRLKQFLAIERLQLVGDPEQTVRTVAVGLRRGGRVARRRPAKRLRRDGRRRGPLSHVPGGRSPRHRPVVARPFRQRAVRRRMPGRRLGPPVSGRAGLGQPEGEGSCQGMLRDEG